MVDPQTFISADERITLSEQAMKDFLAELNVKQILFLRTKVQEIHAKQLKIINDQLTTLGHVEPHHDVLTHGRD